ncbi:MAG TPA: homoserine O-acetyltransferase [Chitinophagaceae bacterium]|nr:homoserine O-acetyltransferase [Chitinophagaceae bacterium]
MEYFHHHEPFYLENGKVLPELTIAYHTYGTLNTAKDNVIWVCHALTANSDVEDWWPGMVGEGLLLNPKKYFIVCANIIGSCYGSTGPLSLNPHTTQPYFHSFPIVTMRDIVHAHILLRRYLGVSKIHLLIGGSIGGYQAMEWSIIEKDVIEYLLLLATSPSESAWGIAVHTAQRLAIEADSTWLQLEPEAGRKGLKAARAIGMLTYRNYEILVQKQTDPDINKTDDFKSSSYIKHQGDKLAKRFNAYSYWMLTKAMDSHNIARGRADDLAAVLKTMNHKTMIMGIGSDILCPVQEQKFMAEHMPHAEYIEIDSAYGHDGFLVETEKITEAIQQWLPLK